MEMRVLGPLEIRAVRGPVALPAGRAQIVLAALALHAGKVVSQDRLITAAWMDAPPATAKTQLQGMISMLRRCLREADVPDDLSTPYRQTITSHPGGYQLDWDPERLDLSLFRRLIEQAPAAEPPSAAEMLRTALDLWHGQPFEGLRSAYLDAERTYLERLRLTAMETYTSWQIDLGRHAEVIVELTRGVQADPLHEGISARLMLALYRSGEQAEALAVYRAIRCRLVEEIGVEPGSRLQLLHRQILTADPALDHPARAEHAAALAVSRTAPSRPRPAQLPADVPDFAGRPEQMSRLLAILRSQPDRAPAVAAIGGMPGAGKSTLAVHAAHQLRERFPDGQLHIDLGGSGRAPLDPCDALRRMLVDLAAAGPDLPDGLDPLSALYRSTVANRRILIVLDDAEGAAQVRPLLPGTGSSAVLITSRARLTGLAGSEPLDLGPLPESDACALFVAIVGADVAAADPTALRAILTACDGLPLAIRIVGARLRAQPDRSLRDMADRLSDPLTVLDELATDDLDVRDAFQASLDALARSPKPRDRDAAHAFTLLGHWGDPDVDTPSASSLFGQPAEQAEARLKRLVDAHLLESHAGRFRLHPLVRLFAREVALSDCCQDCHSAESPTCRLRTTRVPSGEAASGGR